MSEATVVTPQGVRDGDPVMLRELAERRGAAVLAYAEQVAQPGLGVSAAAETFARFRRAVVEAADPYALDPERTLLRATRFAAAERAPAAPPLRARLRGGASAPCPLVPEMLAARAERELGAADDDRLARHLVRCPSCQEVERRFRAGERAYRDQADVPPPPAAANAIFHALTTAAAVREPSAAAAGPPEPDMPAAAADHAVEAEPSGPQAPPAQPTYEFDALPADAFDVEPHTGDEAAPHEPADHVDADPSHEPYRPDGAAGHEPYRPDDAAGHEPYRPDDAADHEPYPPDDAADHEPYPPDDAADHEPYPPDELAHGRYHDETVVHGPGAYPADEPYAPEEPAYEPYARRHDHGGTAARYVIPALILLVALLVTLAVAGAFRG